MPPQSKQNMPSILVEIHHQDSDQAHAGFFARKYVNQVVPDRLVNLLKHVRRAQAFVM
jgi:hypothetical protein